MKLAQPQIPPKKRIVPARAWRKGGLGGNSATPERIQKADSPAVLLVKSRTPHKSFLFLLEEKNRRAQIKNCEENFFAGWRGFRATAGLASLLGVLLKKCSNFVQKTPPGVKSLDSKEPKLFTPGGENRIRTCETVARLHAFQACAFSHSTISPQTL